MRELFRALKSRMESGLDTVMVTVVSSEGGTPRKPGARMLIGEEGLVFGTIGGGNVEFRSEALAKEMLHTEKSTVRSFELHPGEDTELDMACGGALSVWSLPISHDNIDIRILIDRMEDLWQKEETFWSVCDIQKDKIYLYAPNAGIVDSEIPAEIIEKFSSKARMHAVDEENYFCQQMLAAGKVYIFGGGHVARALVPILERVKFRCVVIEDRPEYVKREQFSENTTLMCLPIDGMDELMNTIGPDDMILAMTRGHRNDTVVEMLALKTPAKFVGAIGSKGKHAKFRRDALAAGYTEEELSRLVAPLGLDISSDTPDEIAISIASQLIMVRANRPRSDWFK